MHALSWGLQGGCVTQTHTAAITTEHFLFWNGKSSSQCLLGHLRQTLTWKNYWFQGKKRTMKGWVKKKTQGKKHKGCCLKTKHFLSKLPGDFYKALKLLCNAGVPSMRNAKQWEKKEDEKKSLWESRRRRRPCCSPLLRAQHRGARQRPPSQGDPTLPPWGWEGQEPAVPEIPPPVSLHPMQPSASMCHQLPREMQPYSPPSHSQLTGYQLPSQFSQKPSNKLNSHMCVSASSHQSCLLNYRLTMVWGSSLPSSSCKKIIKLK